MLVPCASVALAPAGVGALGAPLTFFHSDSPTLATARSGVALADPAFFAGRARIDPGAPTTSIGRPISGVPAGV